MCLKVILILELLFLSPFLLAQSDIGSVTNQQTNCEMQQKNCKQVLKTLFNENNKLLQQLMNLKVSSDNQMNILTNLKLTNKQLTQDLTKLSQDLNESKIQLENSQTNFTEYQKEADEQISKWRGRCIWVTIGVVALTVLMVVK